MAGSSDLEALEMNVNDFEIDIVGASDATISVSQNLKADLAGACSLKYKGTPKNDIETAGACDVKQL